ncbi:phospholipid-transporting ATPase IF isoform X1 [Tachysurus ichikawai]
MSVANVQEIERTGIHEHVEKLSHMTESTLLVQALRHAHILSPASTLYSVHLFLSTIFADAALLAQYIEAYQGVSCMDSVSCFPDGGGACGFLERLKRANRCQFTLSNTPEEL